MLQAAQHFAAKDEAPRRRKQLQEELESLQSQLEAAKKDGAVLQTRGPAAQQNLKPEPAVDKAEEEAQSKEEEAQRLAAAAAEEMEGLKRQMAEATTALQALDKAAAAPATQCALCLGCLFQCGMAPGIMEFQHSLFGEFTSACAP